MTAVLFALLVGSFGSAVLILVRLGVECWRLAQTPDEAAHRWFRKDWPESKARYR